MQTQACVHVICYKLTIYDMFISIKPIGLLTNTENAAIFTKKLNQLDYGYWPKTYAGNPFLTAVATEKVLLRRKMNGKKNTSLWRTMLLKDNSPHGQFFVKTEDNISFRLFAAIEVINSS